MSKFTYNINMITSICEGSFESTNIFTTLQTLLNVSKLNKLIKSLSGKIYYSFNRFYSKSFKKYFFLIITKHIFHTCYCSSFRFISTFHMFSKLEKIFILLQNIRFIFKKIIYVSTIYC